MFKQFAIGFAHQQSPPSLSLSLPPDVLAQASNRLCFGVINQINAVQRLTTYLQPPIHLDWYPDLSF